MGSCVSRPIPKDHHTHPNPSPAVAGVEQLEHHHKLKDFIPASVLLAHSGSTSVDESFFDAQPRIESDCDEDFYSIDGDYTPSPGIPTIHRRFSTGTPLVLTPSPLNPNVPRLVKVSSTPSHTNTTPLQVIFAPQSNEIVTDKELAGYNPEISPGNKRMRLLELFRLSRDGFADEHFLSDKKSTDTKTTVSGRGGK